MKEDDTRPERATISSKQLLTPVKPPDILSGACGHAQSDGVQLGAAPARFRGSEHGRHGCDGSSHASNWWIRTPARSTLQLAPTREGPEGVAGWAIAVVEKTAKAAAAWVVELAAWAALEVQATWAVRAARRQ
eukprot:7377211-Prymnesium_polylepis.1